MHRMECCTFPDYVDIMHAEMLKEYEKYSEVFSTVLLELCHSKTLEYLSGLQILHSTIIHIVQQC